MLIRTFKHQGSLLTLLFIKQSPVKIPLTKALPVGKSESLLILCLFILLSIKIHFILKMVFLKIIKLKDKQTVNVVPIQK